MNIFGDSCRGYEIDHKYTQTCNFFCLKFFHMTRGKPVHAFVNNLKNGTIEFSLSNTAE